MLRSSKWSFPSGFLTKTFYTYLISSIHSSCPTHLVFPDLITPNKVWWTLQIMKLLIM
jgi:hypothetical protein